MLAFPIAQALSAEVTVTPFRKLAVLPGGLGLGTLLHVLPFQCSMRVRWPVPSLAGPVQPTAHALDAEVAATPANSPPAGVAWTAWLICR
jgi:hypothetical protein